MPLISVVIPTYNRKAFVQEAIDSVLAQTFTDYEIIVVDDGSVDGTETELASRYGEQLNYVWQENQGESIARNKAIEMASGEFIALLDSDDLWSEDKLRKQVDFLRNTPHAGMVSTAAQFIDADGAWLPSATSPVASGATNVTLSDLMLSNLISGPSSVLMRREVLEMTGGFDAQIQYGEDWDLWLRMAAAAQIAILAQPLTFLRLHRHSQSYASTGSTNDKRLREHLSIVGRAYRNNRADVAADLYRTAVQRQYQHAFLRAAAAHDRTAAACYLLHVNASSATRDSLLTRIAQYAPTVVEMTESDPEMAVADYLKCALAVSHRATTRVERRRTAAHAYATVGYAAHARRQYATARACFLRTFWLDMTWLGNVGFLALFIEMLVGTAVAERLRNLARTMRLPALLARLDGLD